MKAPKLALASLLLVGASFQALAQTGAPGTTTDQNTPAVQVPATTPSAGTPSAAPTGTISSAVAPAPSTPVRQVTVDALEDMDLLKPDGGKVGDIEAVAESNADKKQVVVVERGGFLGFFAKQVAVPLENVAFRNDKLTLRDLDAARLESMPEFKNENGAYRDLDDAQQVSISVQ